MGLHPAALEDPFFLIDSYRFFFPLFHETPQRIFHEDNLFSPLEIIKPLEQLHWVHSAQHPISNTGQEAHHLFGMYTCY